MARIEVKSEVTGSVWKVEKAVGDQLAEDDVIMILESMKMEITVQGPRLERWSRSRYSRKLRSKKTKFCVWSRSEP